MIKIDNVAVVVYPSEYSVTVSDLDDGTTTTRTMDGLLHRDRIAVKRKIQLKWNILTTPQVSSLLQSMSEPFFEVNYLDPLTGTFLTKTFYVGDRSVPVALKKPDGSYLWDGLALNLIER